MEIKINHFSHQHPLVFEEVGSNQSEDGFYCSGCGEEVLGPCYSCVFCLFYLHQSCAEAPAVIAHPFHPHPLILRNILGLPSSLRRKKETFVCDLCQRKGKGFVYCCSACNFNIDTNCVLLPLDTSGNFTTIKHFAHEHQLVLIENNHNKLKHLECSGCSAKLVDASYTCFRCRLFFDKKCVELPLEINHPYNQKHRLHLEFETNHHVCDLCESKHPGLFYCCSLCDVHIHGKCASPPPTIEDKSHPEHPFTLLLRPHSFTCDACGTLGKNASYICSRCNFQVHKDCISYPLFIRINLHRHPLSRIFSLCTDYHDSQACDCKICYKKVNREYGSYYCSKKDCDFFLHVKCAMQNRSLYGVIELENPDEITGFDLLSDKFRDPIFVVIKETKIGEDVIAEVIKHRSHDQHNLTLSHKIKDDKLCDACILPIIPPFYYCSECDFFLHKPCAELPGKTRLWTNAPPFTLNTNGIFRCDMCQYDCSGFCYELDTKAADVVGQKKERDDAVFRCLRCSTIAHSFTYKAHKSHHLFFDNKYEGHCSACGKDKNVIYRCKDCDFALDMVCLTLPHTAWHKCDKHPLRLAYQDNSDYPLHHYCDICEEKRDPKYWFYHCKDCDTVAHPKCLLGKYPFIKPRSEYKKWHRYWYHRHPLTLVQKTYYYPKCDECGKPCQELSLECEEHGCNYIAHWKCINSGSDSENDSD